MTDSRTAREHAIETVELIAKAIHDAADPTESWEVFKGRSEAGHMHRTRGTYAEADGVFDALIAAHLIRETDNTGDDTKWLPVAEAVISRAREAVREEFPRDQIKAILDSYVLARSSGVADTVKEEDE